MRGVPLEGVSRAELATGSAAGRPAFPGGVSVETSCEPVAIGCAPCAALRGAGRPAIGGGVMSCTRPSCPRPARALNVGKGAAGSGHERLHRRGHGRGWLQLERSVANPARIALGQDAAAEAELRRLGEALLHLADAADLA